MNTKLLKQKILDLAIRGKLVPQDPNDEPASELLKRIRAEKEKLIAEGKIKRSKKTGDKPHYENVPFGIPESWEWVTFGDVSEVVRGGSPRPAGSKEFYDGTIPFLKVADLTKDDNVYVSSAEYTIKEAGLKKTRFVKEGTLLLTNSGATLGVPKISTFDTSFNDGIAAFLYLNNDIKLYSYWFLKSQTYNLRAINQGAGQPNLNTDIIKNYCIPIPPQTEQLRIVKTIKQLFLLIDAIEKDKQELTAAVTILKSKVIERAIHGKLVSQDANDEPATDLLKRINPAIKPCDTSHYGNLPKSWCICKLKDVFDITMGSSPTGDSLNNKHEGIEFHQGKLCFSELYLNKSEIYTDSPTKLAEKHSILLCVRAPVGVINITEREICIGRGLCSLKPKNGIDFMFAFYALQTHKNHFEANATGTTFKAIGGDTIRNEMFALPPYDEQVRIRKKIESLFYELDLISAEL